MLIRTDDNYIYCSIVTEIDKFTPNLVNLSIGSSKEFYNVSLLYNEMKIKIWKENEKSKKKRLTITRKVSWGNGERDCERIRKRGDMLLSILSTFHPIPSRGDITDNYQL